MEAASISSLSSFPECPPFPIISHEQYKSLDKVIRSLKTATASWDDVHSASVALGFNDDESYSLLLKLSLQTGISFQAKWETAKKALAIMGVAYTNGRINRTDPRETRAASSFDHLKSRLNDVTSASRSRSRDRSAMPISRSSNGTPLARQKHNLIGNGPTSSEDNYVGVPASIRSSSTLPPRSSTFKHRTMPSVQRNRATTITAEPPDTDIHWLNRHEGRAAEFRKIALTSQAWTIWQTAYTRHISIVQKIDETQRKIILKAALKKWKDKKDSVEALEKISQEELRKRGRRVLAASWARWKQVLAQKRRKVWEQQLTVAWEVVRQKRNDRIKRDALQIWIIQTMNRQALRFRRESLLSGTLNNWKQRYHIVSSLNELASHVLTEQEELMKRKFLVFWRRKAELCFLETELQKKRDSELARQYFKFWEQKKNVSIHRREQNSLAIQNDNYRIAKDALKRWRVVLDSKTQLYRIDTTAIDRIVKKRFFDLWFKQHMSHLFYESHQKRLVFNCLSHWITKYNHVSHGLEKRQIKFQFIINNRVKLAAFSQWKEALALRKKALGTADEIAILLCKRNAFEGWVSAFERHRVDDQKAVFAENFFIQRKYWKAWQERLQGRRVDQFRQQVSLREKREMFMKWLTTTRQRMSENVLVEEFQHAVSMRIKSDVLKTWTRRVVDIKSREMEVVEQYNMRVMRSAFQQWTRTFIQHLEDYSMVDSFKAVKNDELKSKMFTTWYLQARRSREIKAREESFVSKQNRKILETHFGFWRERSLERHEKEVALANENYLVKRTWETWKAQTRTLPAIQFNRQRLLKAIWKRWKSECTDPGLVNTAKQHDAELVLRNCWEIWRTKYEANKVLRTVNRNRFRSVGMIKTPVLKPTPTLNTIYRTPFASTPARNFHHEPSSPPRSPLPSATKASSIYRLSPLIDRKSTERSLKSEPQRRLDDDDSDNSEHSVLEQRMKTKKSWASERTRANSLSSTLGRSSPLVDGESDSAAGWQGRLRAAAMANRGLYI